MSSPEPPETFSRRAGRREPLLERLALHRPELRAWALYDWANSAFFTTIVAAVFPIYYKTVAAADHPDALARFAQVTSASMLLVALIAPLLGAMSDFAAAKKRFLAVFLTLGASATAGMFFVQQGDWLLASLLFALGNVGVAASFVFYDSLLPSIAKGRELDRLSTSAYAIGYLGGGLLLALNLAWIQRPEWFGLPSGPDLAPAQRTLPARLAFLSVAVWWVAFSIPLFRRVREPPRTLESDERLRMRSLAVALSRLRETFRELRRFRHAFLFLLAFLAYNDGIGTIIRMATAYGEEIGIGRSDLIAAVLIVQFVGIPCALFFGALAGRIGAKRGILVGLAAYLGICVFAWGMKETWHFYALALLVAAVMGGTQALSRSLFASMVPVHKAGEFFGLFSVLERFAGVLGPMAFFLAIRLTGHSRLGILSLVVFFLAGAALLLPVDVEAGQRAAREAERGLRQPEPGGAR
ncbi:MAG TPA: MFS transporter [Planctomycetota bacterium]|nr:MFS transporter [Planctomycetota bacterium]